MPIMDELNKAIYPLEDPGLKQVPKDEKIEMLFSCRYCGANFYDTVPLNTKIKYWRCILCKQKNAMYF